MGQMIRQAPFVVNNWQTHIVSLRLCLIQFISVFCIMKLKREIFHFISADQSATKIVSTTPSQLRAALLVSASINKSKGNDNLILPSIKRFADVAKNLRTEHGMTPYIILHRDLRWKKNGCYSPLSSLLMSKFYVKYFL